MSNVLIGIIGVILFIGLALAGALFLGPRFQESTNNSKAAAAVQAVNQVASSANMLNVQTGTAPVSAPATGATSITSQLVTTGYLKSVPGNPVTSAGAVSAPALATAAGLTTGAAAADAVILDLGSSADAVCVAVARQSGQTLLGTASAPTSPTLATAALPAIPSGCVKYTGTTSGALTQNNYYVFADI